MKLFTEKDIIDTYNQHVVKEPSYFNKVDERYQTLSKEDKDRWFDKDFPRLASIFDFQDWVDKYKLKQVDNLLATCNTDPELEYIKSNNTVFCDYSENKKYDLHTLDLEFKKYDLIIFNQTLEHLYNPFISMQSLYNHLKVGGYLYTTVPTLNIPHMVPFHFWGITPIGMCMLSKSVGFDVLECGYWGNLKYINYIFSHSGWPTTADVMENSGVITNDSSLTCQSQTWVLLKK
jgi:SAM-dependent methyltransferase